MEIFLVRHGQTDFNKSGIVQGRGIDSDLNAKGLEQAQLFYKAYQHENFEKVYVSSLKRTYQSVQSFDSGQLPFIKHEGLDEISWGIHEGQVSGDSYAEFHRLLKKWKTGDIHARIREGESPHEVQERQVRFLDMLRNTNEQKILICSHGRSMRILLCTLMGFGLDRMDSYPHHNLCLYTLQWDGKKASISKFNDLRHLGK